MIKLTHTNGEIPLGPIWFNPSHIVLMYPDGGGSRIASTDDSRFEVQESPEQILEMIDHEIRRRISVDLGYRSTPDRTATVPHMTAPTAGS